MRWLAFKVLSFICVFIFTQDMLLPWITAANLMPLWCAIILMSLNVMVTIALIDRMILKVIDKIRTHQELTQ